MALVWAESPRVLARRIIGRETLRCEVKTSMMEVSSLNKVCKEKNQLGELKETEKSDSANALNDKNVAPARLRVIPDAEFPFLEVVLEHLARKGLAPVLAAEPKEADREPAAKKAAVGVRPGRRRRPAELGVEGNLNLRAQPLRRVDVELALDRLG